MNHERIEHALLWIIKISLYLLMFAPLLLSANYFFPAIVPKAIYIRLLIELALVAYLPLVVISPRFRPGYHIIWVALAIFAAAVLVSAIAGENFAFSFWGNYERMDGIFSWLHYWALVVIAGSVLKTKKEWLAVFSFSLLSALALAVYGFLQRAGVAHLGALTIYETNLGRITGTIGNPAFLAVYLLFNVAFGLLIFCEKALSRRWRLAALSAIIPVFAAYIMTGSRGAFLGFVAGAAVFFLANLFWSRQPRTRRFIGQGFFVLVAIIALFYSLIGRNQWVTENFGRLLKISASDSTAQTRLISWRGALAGFKDNFWLGVGPQKFDVVFNKYFDPKFYNLVGDETWWDRSHNIILELAATMGILGLLAYLGVALAVFASLWRLGRQGEENRLEAFIIVSLLAAYFIQNLFIFDTVISYLMLSVLVGYAASRSAEAGEADGKIKEWLLGLAQLAREFVPLKDNPKRWWLALALALGLIAPVAYAGNLKLVKHNKLFLENMTLARSRSFSETIAGYRNILAFSNFDNREVGIKMSQYLGQMALSGRLTGAQLQAGYDFVIKALDQIIEQNPKDARLLLAYGNALNVYGQITRQRDAAGAEPILQKAEQVLTTAADLGPARQQVFHSLANTYFIMGQWRRGIDTLVATSAINGQNPKTYWLLALAYLQGGQPELGIQSADAALARNYRFGGEQEAQPVIIALVGRRDWERLLRLYQAIARNVQTVSAQAKAAAVLAQLGRKEEAIAAAKKVLEIDPRAEEQVEDFIKKVEGGATEFFIE